MTNNKARAINSPVIKQLIDETTAEELAKIDTEMTNNKQQTAVEWLIEQFWNNEGMLTTKKLERAKEMEIAGKEMSYADGYAEGYKRALKLIKWAISNLIPPHNESNP
jgi:hypothetical protein